MKAKDFVGTLKRYGFEKFAGVPCSTLAPLLNYLEAKRGDQLYGCTSEGEALAFGAGVYLGNGDIPVIYMQSDGLNNALNVVSSLNIPYEIPALLLISHRNGEPQHEFMGSHLREVINLFGIYHRELEAGQVEPTLQIARAIVKAKGICALTIKKGFFEEEERVEIVSEYPKRRTYLECLKRVLTPQDKIVSCTGISGREAHNVLKDFNVFYMAGSMGYASSIGLGLSTMTNDRIFVLDGDGSLLMNLGALATNGKYSNALIHMLFNNGCHESTGGQGLPKCIRFSELARNCGYNHVWKIHTLDEFAKFLNRRMVHPTFVEIMTSSGVEDKASIIRPTGSLSKITSKFKESV